MLKAELTRREIALILACLGDGTYTAQERKDFNRMGAMALRSLDQRQELERAKGRKVSHPLIPDTAFWPPAESS